MDELEIIKKVIAGEAKSFEELVKKYQERVLRLCYSMVGESQAEDAAQEIFLKLFESLNQFKEKSAFSTWIYRVAANHCLNIISKKKREKTDSLDALMERFGGNVSSLDSAHAPTPPYTGTTSLKSIETKQIVHSVLEQMSPEERMILTLREIEGLNYKEISETLDISLASVKVRLFRARKSFLNIAKNLV